MNELNSAAASFIEVYDDHYDNTQSRLAECGRMVEELEDLKKWRCAVFAGIFLYELCVMFLSIKVYVKGATSVLEIFTVAVVLPALYYYNHSMNGRKCVRTVNACLKQFRITMSLLNTELEEVKHLCEELRRGLGSAARVRLMRLEQSVLEVFLLTEELRLRASADCVAQVWQDYSRAFSELDKMKTRLSFYAHRHSGGQDFS